MPFVSAYGGCWKCGGGLTVRNQRDVTRKKFCSHSCRALYRIETGAWDPMATDHRSNPRRSPRPRRAECEHCHRGYLATGRQRWCQTCVPDKAARQRMQRYGLSDPEYRAMLDSQGGTCALCEADPFAVDHDHRTGQVRGLLCNRCNVWLAALEHSPEWLAAAREYVGAESFRS